MKIENAYTRDAIIIRFRDGDTAIIAIECSHCHCLTKEVLRFMNIESHEPRGDTAAMAKFTADSFNELYRGKIGKLVPNKTRRDKYGRIIGDILIGDELLSSLLVRTGLSWYGVGAPQPSSLTTFL